MTHRFANHDEIAERLSCRGRALEEILARRRSIELRMAAVRASVRRRAENHQKPQHLDVTA